MKKSFIVVFTVLFLVIPSLATAQEQSEFEKWYIEVNANYVSSSAVRHLTGLGFGFGRNWKSYRLAGYGYTGMSSLVKKDGKFEYATTFGASGSLMLIYLIDIFGIELGPGAGYKTIGFDSGGERFNYDHSPVAVLNTYIGLASMGIEIGNGIVGIKMGVGDAFNFPGLRN